MFCMYTYSTVRIILLYCFACFFSYGQEMQTLTSSSGASIQAIILKVEGETVFMRRSDGISFQVSISIFDQASRDKILNFSKAKKRGRQSKMLIMSLRFYLKRLMKY